jgi:hypothetical protein
MAAVMGVHQIDMITGESLGSTDSVGWAMHLAARLRSVTLGDSANVPFDDTKYANDPEANNPFAAPSDNMEYDDEYSEDPDSVELGKSRGKKRKAKDTGDLFPSLALSQSSKWLAILNEYAQHFEQLVLACHCDASLPADMLLALQKYCQNMISDLRNIRPSNWRSAEWKGHFKESNFARAFWKLEFIHVHPLYEIPLILLPLWRQCQIFDSICVLLLLWFEEELHTLSLSDSPSHPSGTSHSSISPKGRLLPEPVLPDKKREFAYHHGSNVGRELASILLDFPSVVPLKTNPSSIFFLCSLENFTEAYEDWLQASLILHGIKASV